MLYAILQLHTNPCAIDQLIDPNPIPFAVLSFMKTQRCVTSYLFYISKLVPFGISIRRNSFFLFYLLLLLSFPSYFSMCFTEYNVILENTISLHFPFISILFLAKLLLLTVQFYFQRAESLLAKVWQQPPRSTCKALFQTMKALISDELLHSDDLNVQMAVASCCNELTRITAPEFPYDDDTMRVCRCSLTVIPCLNHVVKSMFSYLILPFILAPHTLHRWLLVTGNFPTIHDCF